MEVRLGQIKTTESFWATKCLHGIKDVKSGEELKEWTKNLSSPCTDVKQNMIMMNIILIKSITMFRWC